jgi:hypothetical protein
MGQRRFLVLVSLVSVGLGGLLFNVLAPDHFEVVSTTVQASLSDVPTPVVMGGFLLFVVTVWVAGMILFARILYWGWKQVDEYVFWVWNTVLPESPIIRFAAGVTVMLFVFVFGPLVVMQGLEFMDDDDIDHQIQANQSQNPTNQTTPDETQSPSQENSTMGAQNSRSIDHFAAVDIILRAKDPYL